MDKSIKYKGFYGTVEYSGDNDKLIGKVIGINADITYEGMSIEELKDNFEKSVEQYITQCLQKGIRPEKSCSGSFNIRIPPELHRELVLYAKRQGKSLNSVVGDILADFMIELNEAQ